MSHSVPHPAFADVTAQIVARSRRARVRYLRGVAARRHGRPERPCRLVAVVPVSAGAAHRASEPVLVAVEHAVRASGAEPRLVGSVPVRCTGRRAGTVSCPGPYAEVAASTSDALDRQMDGAVLLGVCDQLLMGLVLGAAKVGHLPVVIVPAGSVGSPLDVLWDALGLSVVGPLSVRAGIPDRPVAVVLDAAAFVDGVVAVLANGGSVRHLLYVVGLAATVGLDVRWSDVEALSEVVQVAPQLPAAGLTHPAVHDADVPQSFLMPPARTGGFHTVSGNVGEAVVDVSGVPDDRRIVRAPACVFDYADDLGSAARGGRLHRDAVVVLRGLDTSSVEADRAVAELARLSQHGHRLALVTDGALAQPPGRVPTAALLTPPAAAGGRIGRIRNGDDLCLDTYSGRFDLLVPPNPDPWPPAA